MPIRNSSSILVIVLLMAQGCVQKGGADSGQGRDKQVTTLSGVLEGGAGKSILLEEMGARELIPIDTVTCDGSGAFEIIWSPTQIAFYQMRPGGEGSLTLLAEPGEKIVFKGIAGDRLTYSVNGSPGSELLMTLAAEHKKTLDALGTISRKNREQMSRPDYTTLKQQFDLQFDSITSGFHHYSTSFIKENDTSPAILIALYNLYGQGLPVFSPQTDLEVYRYVDSVLMISHSSLEAVNLLHAQVNEAERIMSSDPAIGRIQKGEIAPDFVSSRPDGTELALSDLKGNYVLLGFWAGWSGPSREENATLRKAAEQHSEKNFVIFQVSLDDDRDTWTRSISEENLEWEHVSDLMRWDSPVAAIYQVEKIPYTMIIGPNGRVIATDLYGEKLLNTLDNLLNN